MFDKQKYLTKGVSENIPIITQLFLWTSIGNLKVEPDYLQVFELSKRNDRQYVRHFQEQPPFEEEFDFEMDTDWIYEGKVYVIDDGEYSTMLLAEEY